MRVTDDSHFPFHTGISEIEPIVGFDNDYKSGVFEKVWLRTVESKSIAFAAPLTSNMVSQGWPLISSSM
jgi:hypothetical protein